MQGPKELYDELKSLIEACEKDVTKAQRGMKAGGVRVRSSMNEIRQLALDLRKSVLAHRSPTKSKRGATTASVTPETAPIVEESPVVVDSVMATTAPSSSYKPYWYSNFAY